MSCDVGDVTECLDNELYSFSNLSVTSPTSQLFLQPFRRFTYITAHSPNPSVASPTSQFILQTFFRFSYVTSSSLNSPGELPVTKAVLINTVRCYGWSFDKFKILNCQKRAWNNAQHTQTLFLYSGCKRYRLPKKFSWKIIFNSTIKPN